MERFILRYTGPKAAPPEDVKTIQAHDGVTVVDTSAKMLLVETTAATIDQLTQALKNWVSTPEKSIPLPDTKPKIRKAP